MTKRMLALGAPKPKMNQETLAAIHALLVAGKSAWTDRFQAWRLRMDHLQAVAELLRIMATLDKAAAK